MPAICLLREERPYGLSRCPSDVLSEPHAALFQPSSPLDMLPLLVECGSLSRQAGSGCTQLHSVSRLGRGLARVGMGGWDEGNALHILFKSWTATPNVIELLQLN